MKLNYIASLVLLFISLTASSASGVITFQLYTGAEVLKEDQFDTRSYVLALGKYEDRQNRLEPENFILKSGKVLRETHEYQRGSNEKDIFDFYVSQLPAESTLLYSCAKRSCGESNNWANVHFNVKQLYGLDQYQHYSVYQYLEDQFITIYGVRRGNGRVYIQLDILKVEKPENSSVSQ